jgi:uncharacterized Zn-finger protein
VDKEDGETAGFRIGKTRGLGCGCWVRVIIADENPASLSLCSPAHTHTLTTHTPFNSQNNLLYSFFWVFSALLPFFHLHHTPSHLHACFLSFSSPYSSPLPSSSSSRNPLPPNPPSPPLQHPLPTPNCSRFAYMYS